MKAYKKYGDIYKFTRQVRVCMKNGYHGTNDGLRDFWVERIADIVDNSTEKDFDCIMAYCLMYHLSYVIEKRDILFNWKRVVLSLRGYTKAC